MIFYVKLIFRLLLGGMMGILLMGSVMIGLHLLYGHSISKSVAFGLPMGLIFGTFMFFYLGISHLQGIRRRGFKLTGKNLNIVHKRTMLLRLPYEQAIDVVRAAIDRLPKTALQANKSSRNRLVATSKITRSSWGEKIVFQIQPEIDIG
ncbi:MAG: hypothetical protein AB4368_03430 [Xenococcaceae cyanobacterium]